MYMFSVFPYLLKIVFLNFIKKRKYQKAHYIHAIFLANLSLPFQFNCKVFTFQTNAELCKKTAV